MQVLLNHATHKNADKSADSDLNPFISLQLLRELEVPMVMQEKQADHSSYFALNERIVAAESCWFAAKVSSYIIVVHFNRSLKSLFLKLLVCDRCFLNYVRRLSVWCPAITNRE